MVFHFLAYIYIRANSLSRLGSARNLGDNWCRIRLVPMPIGDSRCRQRAGNVLHNWLTIGGETVLSHAEQRTLTEIRRTVQHTGHYVWTKETAEYLISTVRRANTRRSAVRNGSDQYAGPCPVRRCVDHRDDEDTRADVE